MKLRVSQSTPANINAAMEANEQGMIRTSSMQIAGSANGTFTVAHDLGETPDDFAYSAMDDVRVRATRNDRASWSATSATLTGSAVGEIVVWFLKRVAR